MARMGIVPGLGTFETAFEEAAWVPADEAGRTCPAGKGFNRGFEKVARPQRENAGNNCDEWKQRKQVDEDDQGKERGESVGGFKVPAEGLR